MEPPVGSTPKRAGPHKAGAPRLDGPRSGAQARASPQGESEAARDQGRVRRGGRPRLRQAHRATCALGDAWAEEPLDILSTDLRAAGAAYRPDIDGSATARVARDCRWPIRREMGVPPRHKADNDRQQVLPCRSEDILESLGPFSILASLEDAGFDKALEAGRQHVGRESEPALKRLKSRRTDERVPEDK